MGSRSRRRATCKPSTPSTESNTTLCLAPDLADPKKWVFKSLTPSDQPIVFGTPRRPGINVDQITPKHPDYCKKVDLVMAPRYHPVPVSVFQAELLRGPNLGARDMRKLGNFKALLDVLQKPHKPKKGPNQAGQETIKPAPETDIYPVLCEALNRVIKLAGSDFVFKDVSHWSENGDIDHRPDVVMYPTHAQAADTYTLTGKSLTKTKVKAFRKPHIARCAYQWMVTALEVKSTGVETGFGFKPGEPLLRDGKQAVNARSQLATYASEIMLRQHRTHLFLFYIAGPHARIFRWDRNGAVVSQPINLATDLKQLLNLVYRLAQADSALQGYDETVAPASDDEIAKLRSYKPGNEYLESYKALMLDNMIEHPIFKIECDEVLDPDGRRKTRASRRKQFLVGKCVSGGYQPIGRCTKAWVCYCLDDDKMLFMKEQWRANAVGVHPEIETYLRLRKHGVRYVATVVAGGDVVDSIGLQKTVSQRFFDKEGIVMSERIHTRLVIKEVGRPLESYAFSGDLIAIVREALIGHQEAWEKAGILHRDVSVGNIMIDTAMPSGYPQGFLIDWDLCKYKEELDTQTGPSQTGISGTWAFGSALSLQYPRKPKELADDLESFVYIPTYCALRWHKHRHSPSNVDKLIRATQKEQEEANHENRHLASVKHTFFYSEIRENNGLSSGGETKLNHIKSGDPPLMLRDVNSPLDVLLKRLFALLKRHYKTIDYDDLEPYQAEPLPSPSREPTPSPSTVREPDAVYRIAASPHAGPSNRLTTSRFSTPSTSSGRLSYTSEGNARPRPLDNHEDILAIFSSALRDEYGQPRNLKDFLGDKIFDQFHGNVVPSEDDYKDPSTRTAAASGETTGSPKQTPEDKFKATTGKRKPDDSGSGSRTDSNPQPKRRLRTRSLKTANHGMYNPSV